MEMVKSVLQIFHCKVLCWLHDNFGLMHHAFMILPGMNTYVNMKRLQRCGLRFPRLFSLIMSKLFLWPKILLLGLMDYLFLLGGLFLLFLPLPCVDSWLMCLMRCILPLFLFKHGSLRLNLDPQLTSFVHSVCRVPLKGSLMVRSPLSLLRLFIAASPLTSCLECVSWTAAGSAQYSGDHWLWY